MLHVYVAPSMLKYSPRRSVPGPGARHIALEYDLVEALRPALVVDLGAGDAVSFFAYCQSMADHGVDGSCYAFDVWDQVPGTHPEATFEAVSAHGRGNYPGLSYFVRMPPRDAQRHFDDGTIDLLRVDGTRADVIAEQDVEAWFRRVRPGGLVVWHGAQQEPGLWSLIASRCRVVLFAEGRGGLGLARKPGTGTAAELLELLFEHGEGADLERYYKHLHEHLEFRRLLAAATRTPKEGAE